MFDVIGDVPRLSIKKDSEAPQLRLRAGEELRWAVSVHVRLPRDAGGEAVISSGVPRDACPSCGRTRGGA